MLYEDDAVVALNKPANCWLCLRNDSDTPSALVPSFCRTEIKETAGLCRASHRSFYVRDPALCKNTNGIETRSFDSFSATLR